MLVVHKYYNTASSNIKKGNNYYQGNLGKLCIDNVLVT